MNVGRKDPGARAHNLIHRSHRTTEGDSAVRRATRGESRGPGIGERNAKDGIGVPSSRRHRAMFNYMRSQNPQISLSNPRPPYSMRLPGPSSGRVCAALRRYLPPPQQPRSPRFGSSRIINLPDHRSRRLPRPSYRLLVSPRSQAYIYAVRIAL